MLTEGQLLQVQELGRLLNYNVHGRAVEDLHVAPERSYRLLHPYENSLDFAADQGVFRQLQEGYAADMAQAAALEPEVAAERSRSTSSPTNRGPEESRASWPTSSGGSPRGPCRPPSRTVPPVIWSVSELGDSPVQADEFCRRFDSEGKAGSRRNQPSATAVTR